MELKACLQFVFWGRREGKVLFFSVMLLIFMRLNPALIRVKDRQD